MPEPAARVSDMHSCPMVDHFPQGNGAVLAVPHVGGPILPPGVPTVLIGGQPAATVGDRASCTGPPDTILKGSSSVRIDGKAAARRGDPTAHGGVITAGVPTVLIGG